MALRHWLRLALRHSRWRLLSNRFQICLVLLLLRFQLLLGRHLDKRFLLGLLHFPGRLDGRSLHADGVELELPEVDGSFGDPALEEVRELADALGDSSVVGPHPAKELREDNHVD